MIVSMYEGHKAMVSNSLTIIAVNVSTMTIKDAKEEKMMSSGYVFIFAFVSNSYMDGEFLFMVPLVITVMGYNDYGKFSGLRFLVGVGVYAPFPIA